MRFPGCAFREALRNCERKLLTQAPKTAQGMPMNREVSLVLLCLGLCASAQAGITYGLFSQDNPGNPVYNQETADITAGGWVGSYATLEGYGTVLQTYTLTLTFASPDGHDITGSVGFLLNHQAFGPLYSLWDPEATVYTYTATFSPGTMGNVDPNGTWYLSFGLPDPTENAGNTILGWSLDITAVPEPVNVALGIFAGVFVVGGFCRTQQVRDRIQRGWHGVNQWLDAV
jgi:hypothetical protein